ncbi:alcohol dehydrogenase [Pokkaliibacter plantistimulans]|uniref:Alcohol dehydrogenase n=1 Tax=Pokkaliibacter plantistimulans TaxID=1635171 RepID=A0ABX5LZ52_9GAMM|nr:MDR family oxidoreductase [Pokkaliibacter plantistimulans]PXF31424.1 alcohol dehydrogenase [Pokkaliibacter plantistimulans]
MFKALLISKDEQGYRTELTQLDDQQLPAGDVTVAVDYSTLNYKDALAIAGTSPIVRSFPMVPGIDLVGTIENSHHADYKVGDKVLLNGWGVGESHWGGLAQKARLQGDWLIPLPTAFTAEQTMAIGTAGYTAMLCVLAIEKHGITPSMGSVLVTGANGGVGSFALSILSRLGYTVTVSTGRPQEAEYLKQLGAAEIIERSSLSEPGRPLAKERWVAAVDSVGSHTLANVCAATANEGIVAACGLAQGMDFPASVAPFILRGVTLRGINCVTRPKSDRIEAWQRLGELIDPQQLALITQTIGLAEAIPAARQLLDGQVRGRVVVDVNR